MTDLLILYFLAIVDGMFVGYRDAIGRTPRLDKRRFFVRAMASGIWLSQLAIACIAAAVIITFMVTPDSAMVFAAMQEVTAVMRPFYLTYAGFVAVALCFYAIPNYDLQSYLTVTTLASLTLVRPLVIIAGALTAAIYVGDPVVWPVCAVVAISMASIQPLLHKLGWNHFDWKELMAQESSS